MDADIDVDQYMETKPVEMLKYASEGNVREFMNAINQGANVSYNNYQALRNAIKNEHEIIVLEILRNYNVPEKVLQRELEFIHTQRWTIDPNKSFGRLGKIPTSHILASIEKLLRNKLDSYQRYVPIAPRPETVPPSQMEAPPERAASPRKRKLRREMRPPTQMEAPPVEYLRLRPKRAASPLMNPPHLNPPMNKRRFPYVPTAPQLPQESDGDGSDDEKLDELDEFKNNLSDDDDERYKLNLGDIRSDLGDIRSDNDYDFGDQPLGGYSSTSGSSRGYPPYPYRFRF